MSYISIKYPVEIRGFLHIINSTCGYHPIWKLCTDNTISKIRNDMKDNEIIVPTSLQISELVMKVFEYAAPMEMAAFFVHVAQVSTLEWRREPGVSTYELELITLGQMINLNDEYHTILEKRDEDFENENTARAPA